MKRILTTLAFVVAFAIVSHAQVDNYCLRFTSNEGIVNLGKFTTLKADSPYTIQFWFCPSEWNEGAALLRCGTYSIRLGKEHSLVFNDGQNHFFVTSDQFATNQWAQVTVRANKEGTTIHVNNGKHLQSATKLVLPVASYSIWLGGNYKGRIDEVRLFRVVLSESYDSFWRNTINNLAPCWTYLSGYWKMDQEQCPNVVDYKSTHHGTMSASGVMKEKVTDNNELKYRITLAYGNLERYCDRQIDERHYSLSNKIAIVGAHLNTSDGRVRPDISLEEGTAANGAEHMPEWQKRKGVLSLPNKAAQLRMPAGILDGLTDYTFETWLYLDQWTEGGFIFRSETADGKLGISLRLGKEEEGTYILRCNGTDFTYPGVAKVGQWQHVAFTPGAQTKNSNIINFSVNGSLKAYADPESYHPSLVTTYLFNINATPAIGGNLLAKFDDTMLFRSRRSASADKDAVPLPGPDRTIPFSEFSNYIACYSYDVAHRPGLDSFSVPGLIYRMRSYNEGKRGCKFLLTVAGNNFESFFANDTKRIQIADDIAALGNDDAFDGVDLDFEWTYTPWGWKNYARLCENLHWRLKDGKSLSLSPHVVAHGYPADYYQYVNFFNFQIYDRKDLATQQGFINAQILFEKELFPANMTVLSYATTSTFGHVNGKEDQQYAPRAYRYMYPGEEEYNPNRDYITDKDTGVDYYLPSYNQVEWRAKYVVECGLAGIMYWDLGGDLPSTSKHCYARGASYFINSNVDDLVTEVSKPAASPEQDTFGPIDTEAPDQNQKNLESLDELENNMVYTIINANGLGSLCYNGNTSYVWLGASSHENFNGWVNYSDPGAQWLVIQYQEHYYLYCIKPQKFVEVPAFDVTSQATFFTDEPKPIEVTVKDGTFAFRTYTSEENGYLCASPQLKERPVCQWSIDDSGSRWHIRTMPDAFAESALRTALIKIDPTAVSLIPSTTTHQPTTLYDLQGRAVSPQVAEGRNSARGLYIKNRKVVMNVK